LGLRDQLSQVAGFGGTVFKQILINGVIVLATTLSASAEVRYGLGQGLSSCGAWIQARNMHNVDQMLMEQWIAGYLSEANLVGPDIDAPDIPDLLKGEDWAGLTDWIDNYCNAHPLDKLYTAANGLVLELGRRHAPPPKPEEKN
jgi:hypothetical protein